MGKSPAKIKEYATVQADRDLWRDRANAQLEITRAAVAIVSKPYQMYASRGYGGAYLISTKEFEELQRAVDAYKKLAEMESAL